MRKLMLLSTLTVMAVGGLSGTASAKPCMCDYYAGSWVVISTLTVADDRPLTGSSALKP